MGNQQLLIQIPTDNTELRVGVIQGDPKGKGVEVLWEGSETPETVQMGSGFRKTVQDSLTYLIYVDPAAVLKLLEIDPTELFYRALKEYDYKPKNYDDVMQLLEELAIDSEVLSNKWKSSLEDLANKEDVTVVGGKKITVKAQLRRAKPSIISLEPEMEAQADGQNEDVVNSETDSNSTANVAALIPDQGAQEIPVTKTEAISINELLSQLFSKQLMSSEGVELNEEVTPLFRALIQVLEGGEPTSENLEHLVLHPLETASQLLPVDQEIVSFTVSISPSLLNALIAPLILNKASKIDLSPEELAEWTQGQSAALALRSVHLEYSKLNTDLQSISTNQVFFLAELLFESHNSNIELEDVIWLLELAVSIGNKQSEKLMNISIEYLIDAVKKKDNSAALETLATSRVSRVLSKTPFLAKGGRTAFVAALGHIDEEYIASPEWWKGFDWEALNTVATGPLAPLLVGEKLTAMVRKPVVDAFLSEVSGRKMLAEVIGASSLATDLVEAEVLAALFDRAASSDKLLANWLPTLKQQQQLDSLVSENDRLSRDLSQLVSSASKHIEIEQTLEKEIALLRSKLDEVKGASTGVTDREKQQIQIESLRTIAQLAASVEQVIPYDLAAGVNEKLINLLRRQGIEATSVRGQQVSFDPVIHSCPGKRPADGEPVLVGRSGYKWTDKGIDIVLLQAMVASV